MLKKAFTLFVKHIFIRKSVDDGKASNSNQLLSSSYTLFKSVDDGKASNSKQLLMAEKQVLCA